MYVLSEVGLEFTRKGRKSSYIFALTSNHVIDIAVLLHAHFPKKSDNINLSSECYLKNDVEAVWKVASKGTLKT